MGSSHVIASLLVVVGWCSMASLAEELINCRAINSTLFTPPQECEDSSLAVKDCGVGYAECSTNATSCAELQQCVQYRLSCLYNLPAPLGAVCESWEDVFSTSQLYVTAGGTYNNSALQLGCFSAGCTWATEGRRGSLNDGRRCDIAADVCGTPVVLSRFTIVFSGNWDSLVAAPDTREAIRRAAQAGLSTVFSLPPYLIRVLDLRIGSLSVDFMVTDPSIAAQSLLVKLEAAAGNPAAVAVAFADLQRVAGFQLIISTILVESPDGSVTPSPGFNGTVPAPTTGAPPGLPVVSLSGSGRHSCIISILAALAGTMTFVL